MSDELTSENSICRYADGLRSFETLLPRGYALTLKPGVEDRMLVSLSGEGAVYSRYGALRCVGGTVTTLASGAEYALVGRNDFRFLLVEPTSGATLSQEQRVMTIDRKTLALYEKCAAQPQFDGFTTTHYFAGRLYGRRVWRPAGVFVIGWLHRYSHLSILLSGELSHRTGDGVDRIQGPAVFVGQGGTKRWTYAHTDAEFMTVNALPTAAMRDLNEVEKHVSCVESDVPRLYDVNNRVKKPEVERCQG